MKIIKEIKLPLKFIEKKLNINNISWMYDNRQFDSSVTIETYDNMTYILTKTEFEKKTNIKKTFQCKYKNSFFLGLVIKLEKYLTYEEIEEK